jgi:hypothetical protein
MTNKEAENQIKRLILDLEILLEILKDSRFNADKKENIELAIRLLQNINVWPYEDYPIK